MTQMSEDMGATEIKPNETKENWRIKQPGERKIIMSSNNYSGYEAKLA